MRSSVNALKTGQSDEREKALAQMASIVEKSKLMMQIVVDEGGIPPVIGLIVVCRRRPLMPVD